MHTTMGQFFDASLDNESSCRTLFDEMNRVCAPLMPWRYGKTEPLRQPFSVDGIVADWNDAIFWKGKSPPSEGHYWPRNRLHANDTIYIDVNGLQCVDALVKLLACWADGFPTCFGYVHVVADAHVRLPEYSKRIMPFGQGLAWRDIEQRLPCVAWFMWFGPSFVQRIGRESLLSAPAFKVTETRSGICLQLTESVKVLVEDYPAYRCKRDALIRYLGPTVVAPVEEPE